jgi:hypothetical protein
MDFAVVAEVDRKLAAVAKYKFAGLALGRMKIAAVADVVEWDRELDVAAVDLNIFSIIFK